MFSNVNHLHQSHVRSFELRFRTHLFALGNVRVIPVSFVRMHFKAYGKYRYTNNGDSKRIATLNKSCHLQFGYNSGIETKVGVANGCRTVDGNYRT